MSIIEELPYCKDSARIFEPLANRPWAVFLDSGYPSMRQGRYDIMSAAPMLSLITHGQVTEIRSRYKTMLSPEDPVTILRRYLKPTAPTFAEVPFCGGAIGYFSYDLGRRWERLPVMAKDDEILPEMAIGIYDWVVVVDHCAQKSWLLGQGRDPETLAQYHVLIKRLLKQKAQPRAAFRVVGDVISNMNRKRYAQAYQRVKDYIRNGDCYQVNLAQRFSVLTEGDPWLGFRSLREINPAPFAAYLNTPYAQILSASPERFLRVVDGCVETQPIKGTSPRAADPESDRKLAQALQISQKNKAENLMIVDLLRNDLSKNCALGSVKVPRLFDLQSFATVHHLVSTITGKLEQRRDALDLLRGCFPGGSITGAPKIRAMEIIEELEPHRRGVYCGSIGYIGFDGTMDTNIAIRTLVHIKGRISFWAGGGIVADSSLEGEYQETFDKAAAMLSLLKKNKALNHVGC